MEILFSWSPLFAAAMIGVSLVLWLNHLSKYQALEILLPPDPWDGYELESE